MSESFVHLHTHSEYSVLDGLSPVESLVQRARDLGQTALALTDHGVMHGAIEFSRSCRQHGIKPILGVESYLTRWNRSMQGRDKELDRSSHHLLLLAQNDAGYRNLLKLTTDSHLEGYYYRPRVDHDRLDRHSDGVICTTGCLSGEVPSLLAQGKKDEADERLRWYLDVFSRERFFIELQQHDVPILEQVNKGLLDLANRHRVEMVVTSDVHYVHQSDNRYQDILLCVQTGKVRSDEKRMRMDGNTFYLRTRQELEEAFRPYADLPDSAFTNTLLISEMCEVDPEDDAYHLPQLPLPKGFEDAAAYLRHKTERGLRQCYGDRAETSEIQGRMEAELSMIGSMGFDMYFLIVADLCDFARDRGIWWNVRGSGAGSIVAHALGITSLDPLKYGLIFERFLNPGRLTMPDFDLDYPDDQREEVIRYTIEKYGDDQVAQIVTFGRMKSRAAIRDVGRVLSVPLPKVDRLAKQVPAGSASLKQLLDPESDSYQSDLAAMAQDEELRELMQVAPELEGVARNASVHAAAVIIADKPLWHYTPLSLGKNTITKYVTQYEFPVLESIGLLKVDYLGLSTLSIMREACRLIRERHDVDLTIDTIPFDAPAETEAPASATEVQTELDQAFDLLSSGETTGVFQVESDGFRETLKAMRPTRYIHIIAALSLYRPGPMDYIDTYNRRMHGEEQVEYLHESLAPILAETYGIIVYQEQIIQIIQELAGYSAAEADLIRQAISKKDRKKVDASRGGFLKGGRENGIDRSIAGKIWSDIELFAGYGFNKSHAADYAKITVQTAYLKAKYPQEYMMSMLLVERDADKVTRIVQECQRMGIKVLGPDVNHSHADFAIETLDAAEGAHQVPDPGLGYPFPIAKGSAIRFGLAAIKNVSARGVQEEIIQKRPAVGFANLEAFCDTCNLKQLSRRSMDFLIRGGAMDRWGNRKQLLECLDAIMERSRYAHQLESSGQASLFGDQSETMSIPVDLPEVELTPEETMAFLNEEKELLGINLGDHPIAQLHDRIARHVPLSTTDQLTQPADEKQPSRKVLMVGLVVEARPYVTRKGDTMAFITVEDLYGQIPAICFSEAWSRYRDIITPNAQLIFRGELRYNPSRSENTLYLEEAKTAEQFLDATENAARAPVPPPVPAPGRRASNGLSGHGASVPENGRPADRTMATPAARVKADRGGETESRPGTRDGILALEMELGQGDTQAFKLRFDKIMHELAQCGGTERWQVHIVVRGEDQEAKVFRLPVRELDPTALEPKRAALNQHYDVRLTLLKEPAG